MTWSPSLTPSATFTRTPQDLVTVRVSVFNEAGEQVGVISDGLILESAVNEFFFRDGLVAIDESNFSIVIIFPDDGNGGVTLTWLGLDESGQPLANGSYVVKVESVDSLGITTVLTGTASILRAQATATVRIYNEAGELIYSRQLAAGSVQQSDVAIEGSVVDPSMQAGTPGSTISIQIGTFSLAWQGTDQAGRAVANGQYLLEISLESGAESSVITETVTVLNSGPLNAGSLRLNPNPVAGNEPVALRVAAGSLGGKVRVYTVSAELVVRFEFMGDNASWDLRDGRGSLVSAGMYLVVVESIRSDGSVSRALGRLVILR